MSARLRLTGTLLPLALLLHEALYAASGGGLRPSHEYLHLGLPALAALAASAVAASILLPLLAGRSSRGRAQMAPPALAGALAAIFAAQELGEALLLGGGAADALAALASAWLLPPMALALGALAARILGWLESAELALQALLDPRARRSGRPDAPARPRPRTPLLTAARPLAFGLARRPPPAAPGV